MGFLEEVVREKAVEQPQLETSRGVQTSSSYFQFRKCGFPAPDLQQIPDCPEVLWNPSQQLVWSRPWRLALVLANQPLWLCLDIMGLGLGLGEGHRLQ